MYMKVITSLCNEDTNQREEQGWYGDFSPEVHVLANTLVPIKTSSKVAIGPLASGDLQVTLSNIECLP